MYSCFSIFFLSCSVIATSFLSYKFKRIGYYSKDIKHQTNASNTAKGINYFSKIQIKKYYDHYCDLHRPKEPTLKERFETSKHKIIIYATNTDSCYYLICCFIIYQMIQVIYHLLSSKYYSFNSILPNLFARKMQLFFIAILQSW